MEALPKLRLVNFSKRSGLYEEKCISEDNALFENPIHRETSSAREQIRTSTGYKRVGGAPMLVAEIVGGLPATSLQCCKEVSARERVVGPWTLVPSGVDNSNDSTECAAAPQARG
jgi:hypothetical protein